MTKNTFVAALCLWASFTLTSCCSLCSQSAQDDVGGGPPIVPTPGNNCIITIQPQVGSGQPSMWISYNFENENPSGTTNTIKLGSTQVDLSVGGARVMHGANRQYALKITNLTGASPTGELIEVGVTPPPAPVPITVSSTTSSGNSLQTFTSYVRQEASPSDRLLLNILENDKGVEVVVSAWPNP